jgi:hypothetical protein
VLVRKTHLVAVAYMVVVMSPRAVVVARLRRAEVVSVIEV